MTRNNILIKDYVNPFRINQEKRIEFMTVREILEENVK